MTSLFPYQRFGDVELRESKEIEIFSFDGLTEKFVVTPKTTVADICWKRFAKHYRNIKYHWTISELWKDQMIERTLEYHERILQVYNDNIADHGEDRMFIFRCMDSMFEIYTDQKNYQHIYKTYNVPALAKEKLVQKVADGDINPLFYGKVWIYDGRNLDASWEQKIVLMMDKILYFAPHFDAVVRSMEENEDGTLKPLKEYQNGSTNNSRAGHPLGNLETWVYLNNCQVFRCTNANTTTSSAPGERGCFSLCLLLDSGFKLYICCENQYNQKYWMCAMRLSKYGKQLRDNYRSFVKKQSDPNEYEYKKNPMPNESIRSHVAMDFRGNVGRIVEDPIEAQAIAELSGTRRSGRNHCRHTPVVKAAVSQLNHDVHLSQPWYHKNMSRDQAATLLNGLGDRDGVFLIRESQRNTDGYVLSYKYSGKISHLPIATQMDSVHGRVCFSLDKGVTKFYDLLQLVEFYQLNLGPLPIRLMHYVSNEPTTNTQ